PRRAISPGRPWSSTAVPPWLDRPGRPTDAGCREERKMARRPYLDKSDLLPEHQDLLARNLNLYRVLAHSPRAARSLNTLARYIRDGSRLDPRLRELAILQVGYLTGSAWEFSHHVRIGREIGLTDDEIRAVADEPAGRPTMLDPLAKAGLGAARCRRGSSSLSRGIPAAEAVSQRRSAMRELPKIDRVLQTATDRGDVPGVVAMAATREGPVYQGAFGRRALPDGPLMTDDSVFWIASMTKAITSTAAMQLVERGKLSLDGPIAEVLPELAAPQVLEGFDASDEPKLRPARRPITLRHLITHTAGFVYDIWRP